MKLPSEVLNRAFVLEEKPVVEQVKVTGQFQAITTHAILIGNIGLLLPQNRVSELVENLSVCRLPNTPSWFEGITNVRGNMIPVFDLHELLGVPVKAKNRKVITIDSGETAAAFWVDDMPRMVMVTSDDSMQRRPPLPQLIGDHAQNYYIKDDQIWIELNVHKFFRDVGSRL